MATASSSTATAAAAQWSCSGMPFVFHTIGLGPPLAAVTAGLLANDDNRRKQHRRRQQQHAPPDHNRRTFGSRLTNKSNSHKSTDCRSHHQNPNTISKTRIQNVYRSWWMRKVPQAARFFVAGNLSNLGFFFLEKLFYNLLSSILDTNAKTTSLTEFLQTYQDSVSFFTAYVVQIVTGHLLYAILVYGLHTIDTSRKYWQTLWGQFQIYGFGLIGATALQGYLLSLQFDKTTAFIITTASFAGINYLLVSWVVQRVTTAANATKR